MNCRSVPAFVGLSLLLSLSSPAGGHELVDYRTDVDPILHKSCGGGACHIDQTSSGVNLTSYASTMASRGDQYKQAVVIPGDPDGSPLMDKVINAKPRFGDPMPREGTALTDVEIGVLRRWIQEGATERRIPPRGDANGDDALDISDPIAILAYLYMGGAAPKCPALLDPDVNGIIELTDVVFLLGYLFLDGAAPSPLTPAEADSCDAAGELSFSNIMDKVFTRSCSFSSCHATTSHKGGLVLDDPLTAYQALVGIAPQNEAAREEGFLRVDPGRPESSFLLRKLVGPGPGEGNRMPANSSVGLSETAIAGIREWVLAGAPFEGSIHGVPALGDLPDPPIDRLPPPPVPESGIQLHLPPFAIGPGEEREIFYFLDRPLAALAEDPDVERIDIHMSEESHHFILYEWTGSSKPPAGVRDIGGVFDIINGRRLMLGSQQSFFSLSFPSGVGLKMSRDASFDLNSHYLNLNGAETLYGEVYINIFFAPKGSIQTYVQPIFDINYNISVPPYETRTTKAYFPMASSGRVPAGREVHIYSLGSHMHRHGTRFSMFLVADLKDVSPPQKVYDNLDWDDPLFELFDPPLVLKAGQGLRFETTHTYDDPPSPTADPLVFGLTSEDEMAIILGYMAVK